MTNRKEPDDNIITNNTIANDIIATAVIDITPELLDVFKKSRILIDAEMERRGIK